MLKNNSRLSKKRKYLAALLLADTDSCNVISRRWWVRPLYQRRYEMGFYQNSFLYMKGNDPEKFFNYTRMDEGMFDHLLSRIEERLHRVAVARDPISASERFALTLRYLASGDSMASMSHSHLIAPSTVSTIILDTCNVIWETLRDAVLPTLNSTKWAQIQEEFLRQWNFPNCVGAIDGKHVTIQAPNNFGSTFYNYKHSHSIVLMAGCDANYCFTFVDIGAAGRQSDGGVFSNSNFGSSLLNGSLDLPKSCPIVENGTPVPSVFLTDEAFPLKPNMMRPYPGNNKGRLPLERAIFNYRLSRGRRVIENVFGICASRWRILRKPIIAKIDTVESIIKAIVVLHNFLQLHSNRLANRYCPAQFVDFDRNGEIRDGIWRQEGLGNGLQGINRLGSNNYSSTATEVREIFTSYFMNEGQVPWQWEKM